MCKYPGCNETKPLSRGLCAKCYSRAYIQVRRGRTTWEELFSTNFVDLNRLSTSTTEQRSQRMLATCAQKRELGVRMGHAKKPSLADLDNQMIDTLYPPGYNGMVEESQDAVQE